MRSGRSASLSPPPPAPPCQVSPDETGHASVLPLRPGSAGGPLRSLAERLAAVGYGVAYDRVVTGFPPYETLLDEVLALVARSRPAATPPGSTRVLDIACGTGTVVFRLVEAGYCVTGLDPVARLVDVARRRHRAQPLGQASFQHLDLAREPVAELAGFDVVLSLHTLYWHPDPRALLEGCRRALRPGGHAIVVTYARPARILPTVRRLCRQDGLFAGARALRWLVPTAIFEALRHRAGRYLTRDELAGALAAAGFQVLELRPTFLAGLSHLAWVHRT